MIKVCLSANGRRRMTGVLARRALWLDTDGHPKPVSRENKVFRWNWSHLRTAGQRGCTTTAFVIAFLIAWTSAASAQAVQDQSFTPSMPNDGLALQAGGTGRLCCEAQTFTAGVSGTLTSVQLKLLGIGNIQVAIYSTANGAPLTLLQSLPFVGVSAPTDTFVTFSGFNLPVVAGVKYAIVAGWQKFSGVTWSASAGIGFATYPGGERYVWNDGFWAGSELFDAEFKTFVVPACAASVAVDFGTPYGVWRLTDTTIWSQLHPLHPEAMVRGDLDGNGLDDLVIDFGSSFGVWVWMNDVTWSQLHILSPSHMVTGDLDGNGRDEVILDFPGFGIWIWSNNTSWSQLHGLNAAYLATGDLDNTGSADVIIDFPGLGIWVYANNSTWTQLHPFNGTTILTADLDGSGRDDVIIDFPGFGLWGYYNNASWGQIHVLSPAHVAAGEFDGNGSAELAIDFGPVYGLWLLANNSTWTSLHPLAAEEIVFADRNGDGKDEILIDFGPPYGLWQYANFTGWSQLHPLSPESLVSGRFH